MKIKELRTVNIIVKQNEETVYEGRVEDAPEEIKEQNYKNIKFDGTTVVIEI